MNLRWPLREMFPAVRDARLSGLAEALAAERLSNGAAVARLEQEIARRHGGDGVHCVAVASATLGLLLAVRMLAGGRPGVALAPSFAFGATLLAPLWAGRRIVCLPVDPDTMNLCPHPLERALAEHEVAVVITLAVAGNPSGLEQACAVARRAGAPVVVDAAGALGATLPSGSLADLGDAVVLSMSSRKLLQAGEGGLVLTTSSDVAERLRRLRMYGSADGYYCEEPGLNARLSELHAMAALHALPVLAETLSLRRAWAEATAQALARIGARPQAVTGGVVPAYSDVVVRVPPARRDALIGTLRGQGVDAVPFYHPPAPLHPAFTGVATLDLGDRASELESLSTSTIAIPVYSSLSDEHRDMVVATFRRILEVTPC